MNNETFHRLEDRASVVAEADVIKKLEARSHVKREIERLKAEGEALELSEEEEQMLHSFRRFKLQMRKDGQVFTWQSRKPEGVQIAEETAEILHPQEARR